jgi:hypothetical protein
VEYRPKQQARVTADEVATAKSYLPPNPAWHLGIIEETDSIQYRGAMHPNANGFGTHPGVEVWTNVSSDQVGGKAVAEDLGSTSAEEREAVLSAAEKSGYPRDEVDAAIQIESGWKPHNWYHGVAPEKAAGGLIGFMPFVLKALGWNDGAIAFRAQSSGEQAPWVGKYFAQAGIANRWRVPGDTYLALAASGHVGDADDSIIYAKGTKAWELNPGWRPADGGDITAGSIRALLLRRMGKGWTAPALATPKAVQRKAGLGSDLSLLDFVELFLSAIEKDAEGRNFPVWGANTDSVVKWYQTSRALSADGDVGKLTVAQIRKELAA